MEGSGHWQGYRDGDPGACGRRKTSLLEGGTKGTEQGDRHPVWADYAQPFGCLPGWKADGCPCRAGAGCVGCTAFRRIFEQTDGGHRRAARRPDDCGGTFPGSVR